MTMMMMMLRGAALCFFFAATTTAAASSGHPSTHGTRDGTTSTHDQSTDDFTDDNKTTTTTSAAATATPHSSHHHHDDTNMTPEQAHERPPPRDDLPAVPTVRFTAWKDLSDTNRNSATAAGYQEKTWNKLGESELENRDFESLQRFHTDIANNLGELGITEDSWDCHVNHYRAYEWDELKSEGVQMYYKALGWTAAAWEEQEDEPPSEGQYWADLREDHRQAASQLCYTQQLWDEVALPLWKDDDGKGGDTVADNGASKDEVEEEKQEAYDNLYGGTNTPNQKGTPMGPLTAHNSRNIPTPFWRYDTWENLSEEVRDLATKAHYSERTWNSLEKEDRDQSPESMDWETLGDRHPNAQSALQQMGYTEEQWDCFSTHYSTYDWEELGDVHNYFKVLGWNGQMWNDDQEPEVYGQYWPDLTPEQQEAAYELCYFRETWDEVSLQFWPVTTSSGSKVDAAKQFAKDHPVKAGGVSVAVISVLVGFVFVIGCFCKGRCPGTSRHMNKHELQMMQYYHDNYESKPYRDDDDDANNTCKDTIDSDDFDEGMTRPDLV